MIPKKPKKPPRQPGENLDTPRRYAVKTAEGQLLTMAADVREMVARAYPEAAIALMGSHEELGQVAKRVGW